MSAVVRALVTLGAWLTGKGCWCLPAMLAAAVGVQWLFGELWYTDAPYYQAISLLASREGHWWTLKEGHAGGINYFNKPPLVFWMHAVSARVLGEHDYAYRLPELLAFMAMCAAVASIARGLVGGVAGGRVGVLAGCAMALTDDWIWRVANFRLEYVHTLGLVIALGAWARAMGIGAWSERRGRGEWTWAIVGGIGMGTALMTKPLIGLGLPLFVLIWLVTFGAGVTRRCVMLIAVGAATGVLIAVPWHLSMVIQHGETFTRNYFLNHSLKRATGEMFDPEPWWWYLWHIVNVGREERGVARMWVIYGLAIVGMVSALLGWLKMWRGAGKQSENGAMALGSLAVLWTVGLFVIISVFGDKRSYYIMIVHPGTAWLCGYAVWRVVELCERMWGRSERLAAGVRDGFGVAAIAGVAASVVMMAITFGEVTALRERRRQPAREQLVRFVQEHQSEPIYNLGMAYAEAAFVYVRTGVWPRYVQEKEPVRPADMPSGSLGIYQREWFKRQRKESWIDPNDSVVFEIQGGSKDFVIVRRK